MRACRETLRGSDLGAVPGAGGQGRARRVSTGCPSPPGDARGGAGDPVSKATRGARREGCEQVGGAGVTACGAQGSHPAEGGARQRPGHRPEAKSSFVFPEEREGLYSVELTWSPTSYCAADM